MIKSKYTIDEVLTAMEANAILQRLIDWERGRYHLWAEQFSGDGVRMEVLRFNHQLEATWLHLPPEVKGEIGRGQFYKEVFEKYVDFAEQGLSLSASIQSVAQRISRDYSRGAYPFGDGTDSPVYLTSACCEVTEQYDDLLMQNGLAFGAFDGGFYPLTEEESKFIADDVAEVDDGYVALMGYSSLYRGKKFLMPSVEVSFDAENEMSRDLGLHMAYEFADQNVASIEEIGGHILVDADADVDKHVVQVLIPFDYAATVADDYAGWKTHLERALLPNTNPAASFQAGQ
ncbi:hypothetical protein G6L37_03445 [Agrobacterium rubi]|nr:hypothetical protein [Agrobacterium rubi]NTF24426.1 hypothetical protein [Agrobacterium rubi]